MKATCCLCGKYNIMSEFTCYKCGEKNACQECMLGCGECGSNVWYCAKCTIMCPVHRICEECPIHNGDVNTRCGCENKRQYITFLD